MDFIVTVVVGNTAVRFVSGAKEWHWIRNSALAIFLDCAAPNLDYNDRTFRQVPLVALLRTVARAIVKVWIIQALTDATHTLCPSP